MTNQDFLNQNLGEDALDPQEGSFEQTRFGLLTTYAVRVKLVSGAPGYQIPGALNFEGQPKQFTGRVPDPNSKQTHVVMVLEQFKQDGESYTRNKNYMTFEKPYAEIVKPGLDAVFGKAIKAVGRTVPVRLSEVPTGEEYEGHPVKAWRVEEQFPTKEAMLAASETFFAQFSQNGTGENPYAGLVEVPEQWVSTPEVYLQSIPDIMAIIATAKVKPVARAMWENDPAIASLADFGLSPGDAAKLWEKREQIAAVPPY